MSLSENWNVRTLQTALNEQPRLSLDFYSYGVMLRKREGDLLAEHAVDPAQVMVALAAKVSFDTGLLSPNTLLVQMEGVKKTVVAYRKGQLTGIYLDDMLDALRVPLPPLVMIRTTRDNHDPSYTVYAVKRRPTTLDVALFHAPLPNVYLSALICWGSVKRVSDSALSGTLLVEDFGMLLGTPFGNHACSGKSVSFPQDIRKKLIELEKRGIKRYPTSDLIPAKKTLAHVLGDPS